MEIRPRGWLAFADDALSCPVVYPPFRLIRMIRMTLRAERYAHTRPPLRQQQSRRIDSAEVAHREAEEAAL